MCRGVEAVCGGEFESGMVFPGGGGQVDPEITGVKTVAIELGVWRAGDRFRRGVGPPTLGHRILVCPDPRHHLEAGRPVVALLVAVIGAMAAAENHALRLSRTTSRGEITGRVLLRELHRVHIDEAVFCVGVRGSAGHNLQCMWPGGKPVFARWHRRWPGS